MQGMGSELGALNEGDQMKNLSAMLGQVFKPAAKPKDPFRKARAEAKQLASQHGIEIEPLRPGFNVWAPAGLSDTPADPFEGDHYADDWSDVLERVKAYVSAAAPAASAN